MRMFLEKRLQLGLGDACAVDEALEQLGFVRDADEIAPDRNVANPPLRHRPVERGKDGSDVRHQRVRIVEAKRVSPAPSNDDVSHRRFCVKFLSRPSDSEAMQLSPSNILAIIILISSAAVPRPVMADAGSLLQFAPSPSDPHRPIIDFRIERVWNPPLTTEPLEIGEVVHRKLTTHGDADLWDSLDSWRRYQFALRSWSRAHANDNMGGLPGQDAIENATASILANSKGHHRLPAKSQISVSRLTRAVFLHFGDDNPGDAMLQSVTVLSGPLKGHVGWLASH